MNLDLLKQLLVIAVAVSVVTCSFIQKTKGMFKKSKWINPYSLVVNVAFGVAFCLSFTEMDIINGLWVGLFSYIGADTLYKTLEGKLKPYSELNEKKVEVIVRGDK